MEVKKAENHQIKSITPIKGEILAKLRSKLIRTNKSNAANSEATLNNNNQNGQTNTQVKKEVEPDKKIIIKSVENVHIDLTSIIPNNTAHSHVTATRSDPIVKSDEDSKQPVKILSAKMPENDFNKKIPLKMVRTIQRPKPNVQQRRQCFGKVQVYQSSSDTSIPLKTTPEPVQPEIVNMMQQPEHPVEIFKGFTEEEQRDHMLDKLSLWKELLSMDESALKSIWESSQNQTLASASESQIITDSMVDSSMMREFAKDLDETEPPEESDDGSMSGSEMDESSDDQSDTEMEIDNAPWLQDIDDLIGEARIKEIEESLKKIPTTATGNLIETENIELKLIINHLLRKINAQSIVETMNPDVTYAASKNIVTESIGVQTSNNICTESIGIQASNNTSTVSKGIQASKNIPTASKSIQASNNILTASKSIQASNNILTESIGIQTTNDALATSNIPATSNDEPKIFMETEDKNESSSEDDDTAGHFDDSPEPFDVPTMDDLPMEFAEEENSENIKEPLCEDKMPTIEESNIAEMPDVNDDVPMPSVPEVPEDISAIEEEPIEEEIIEEQGTPKEAKSHAERKRKNEIFPLATSTAKKLRSEPTYEFVNKQQNTQPPPQEDNTVNEVSRPRRGRQKAKLQKVVVVLEDYSKIVEPVHEKSPEKAPSPPPMIQEINQLRENEGPPSRRTRRYSKIVSESDVPSKSPFCKIELKSHDLNSTESANIVCDDYLNASSSPPLDQARNREPVSAMSVVEQVTESVAEIKTVDPTFYSTGQKEKRPYLRTSAFKGRKKAYETAELKLARNVIQPFVEDIRSKKISFKIYELNRKFIEEYFSDEIFPNFTSNYQTLSQTLRSFSTQLRFRPSSINYVSRQIDNYLTNFESSQVKSDWNELSFGARDLNDSNHILMYCGSSISSMDWAPAEGDDHYLAVACNPNDIQHKLGIEETMKSCVQIYEFNSLVNEKFENFENITSRLLYTFAINDGPIWSVKFHPCGQASNERIGILAVTTAQQDVYIFSLPYLNNNNTPAVIELKPNVICRLSEDITLYQDKFLMQATRVNWHYERDRINVLAVGYVSGDVALWNFEEREDEGNFRYPDIVIQAHHQTITAVDMKPSKNGNYLLLTTCLGREIKLFSINGCRYEELTFSQPQSRILCAEMWRHWAGYVNGNDNSFLLGYVNHRQPFDFGRKNTTLLNPASSIISVNINHWTNSVLITTDAGDVVTVTPHQVASTDPKDKWSAFFTTIVSFTDIKRIPQKNQAPDELGIVFNDLKNNATKKPKNFRVSPIELTNQLQVNHACFNPNEKSHGFFALGYETGFVRVRHMKIAK